MGANDVANILLGTGGFGALGIALYILTAFMKGWIVSGTTYKTQQKQLDAMEQDRDDWREMATINASSAESVIRVSEALRRSRTTRSRKALSEQT